MKIAMIGHKHFPSREGGVEVVVSEIAPLMVKKGLDVTVYDRFELFHKRNFPKKKFNGVKIKLSPTLKNPKVNAMLASLSSTLKSLFKRYDIVHYHAEGSCVMIPIQKLFKRKVVVTIHGLDWTHDKFGGFGSKYIKFGEKMAAKYADEVIVLSDDVKKYFKNVYNRDTILIRNGVTVNERLVTNDICKLDVKSNGYFLYVGRLVPEKGIHRLIEAFNKLETDKKVVIVGDNSIETEYIKELYKMSNDKIIFAGFRTGIELQKLYSNCFAYVLPSDSEAMSIGLLEALGYGIPVIATNVKENTILMNGYGYPFDIENGISLYDVMVKVIKEKPQNNSAQINYIKKKYGWDEPVSDTIELYKKVKK